MNHLVSLNSSCFDYRLVSESQAGVLRELAKAVNARGRMATRIAIKIGQDLLKAKRSLEHGLFADWCQLEAGLNPRTAQSFMCLAAFAQGERIAVNGLALTAACRLAAPSTPPQVVVTVLARLKRGENVRLTEIELLLTDSKNKLGDVSCGRPPTIEAPEIPALVDIISEDPQRASKLSTFLDNASPASLRLFKTELRARLTEV